MQFDLSASFCTIQVPHVHLVEEAPNEAVNGGNVDVVTGALIGLEVPQQTHLALSSSLLTKHVPQFHLGPAGFLTVKRS